MKTISRRTVLRGMGTAMALPVLEAMGPFRAFAQAAPRSPLRMAFVFFPNGVNVPQWFPTGEGTQFTLPFSLQPLDTLKKDVLFMSGLAHHRARANGDGAGDHARSSATFLTGSQAKKTDGKDIKAGISVDQVAAQKLSLPTKLASLEIGCDRGAMAGNCDSGYSCAYSSTVSWRTPTTPNPKEINPRLVFERLFGDPNQMAAQRDRAKQAMYRKSVLDLVREDAQALRGDLGASDRKKLEEYLDSVRAIEKQIQVAERDATKPLPELEIPDGVPKEFGEYVRVMMDILVLALQTDSTRVATFMLANEGSNRTFPWLEVREGHHSLSHHAGNAEKLEKIKKIDRFYVEQFGYLVRKMKSVKEGDGTLLDHSMVVYGCSIQDGNRHNHNELPVLLAGGANGTVTPGRHVRYPKDTPLCNLFLSLLDRMGLKEPSFGDSTGQLPLLKA